MTSLGAALAGVNMIYGGGMLELGQTFSLEQQVIDNDIIMMERKFMEGIPVTDETLAVDAIKFIGIGNDFIAHPSTMEQIDLASDPEIFDRTMLGEWRANGKKDAVDRAHEKVVDILANHIVTPVPDDVMAAWEKIVKEADEVFLKNKE
ncbi:MAG: trimethylamine methyltransferase family protein [Candidatus Methanomethylophilus sp.]|nr:trimethylamine methyltransferase family protein [Methanomethylophilus sp.]MBQ5483567.1 trimethylamine methyltransferase family protein [Methanomethylophilus sp.]